MLQMACAMLDVVDDLTMLDGSKVQIRIGTFLSGLPQCIVASLLLL